MAAYYNEINPFAAQWLRNLIAAKLIAPGEVDERSVEDVTPNDLRGFTQCHFFAGIGVWSYALRLAGWPDDRPVWSGSCPCQPFSAAGKRGGTADERHLWPAFFHLIELCRPPVVFGEQVASKDGLAWLDTVQSDLEASGYAVGATDLCAAGVGAPHIRQRLWFVGVADTLPAGWTQGWPVAGHGSLARRGAFGGLDHHHHQRSQGHAGHGGAAGRQGSERPASETGVSGGVEYGPSDGWVEGWIESSGWSLSLRCGESRLGDTDSQRQGEERRLSQGSGAEREGNVLLQGDQRPGPTNGLWRDADWLGCRDGKWRPVDPGTFPLVNGARSRVGRLRAYGNALVAQAAAAFIGAVMGA